MDERYRLIESLDAEYVLQTFNRLPVAFVRGEGTCLWDTAGREYLDLVSGLGVTVLGHCHPAVTEAVCGQAARLVHTTNLYYVEPQARLARLLVKNSFPGRCFFANSGAEANEGALKLARKYHYLKGRPRGKVVCLEGAFHGRTLATLSATGQPAKREPFKPVMPGFEHVPLEDPGALRDAVDDETAAVMLELIQGESGVRPVSAEVVEAAREACDRTGALLIIDEVQTGLGRTGKLFAFQHYGVIPDVMTLAKGIANGVPTAAFIVATQYADALSPGDHGSTFGGGFLACSAALATVQTVIDDGLPEKAGTLGGMLLERLRSMTEGVGLVKGVRGRGLMLAVQLERDVSWQAVKGCLERGVLVNNVTPDAVRLLPPLIVEEEELVRGAQVLVDVLEGLDE
ncbi:MAG: aspartate aminotransferase family protein [Actinobacteria bacterium]|nr:aspartate aminotransferase family protein [Actinomycetota bacterium]MCG2818503.1 aspartate aminotransferase family protein [Actinomycetes bacterium]MBU4219401.1 aspartate aminotransferase family protein [Actinomycetota bacterium]MBU4358145.1 aspartate aminotransferase family protein [Actinomycetota bacterium]MBU4392565.1 aspartate aminotransferase family protein [Actinomycetota bacterium]